MRVRSIVLNVSCVWALSIAAIAAPAAAQDAQLPEGPAPEARAVDPVASPDEVVPTAVVRAEQSASAEPIPPIIPTEHFASRNSFWGAELSPDGEVMSFFRRVGDTVKLSVVSPTTGEAFNAIDFADGTDVESYQWVNADKMLIQISGIAETRGWQFGFTRLILAYPKEGRFEFFIDDPRSLNGGDVIHVSDDGEYALIAHRGDGRLWNPSVFRYELKKGGAITKVQEPNKTVYSWVADQDGVVRLGLGWSKRRIHVWYRNDADSKLERIGKIRPDDAQGFFEAIQIVSGSSRGYVLDEGDNGRVGIRVFDYETQEIVETFYEHPEWDIEDVWIEDGKPIAAFYTDDRRRAVWFDEDYKKTYGDLKQAIGDRDVWIRSYSKDATKMLVYAGSEADPGVLYFYDSDGERLSEVAQYRPQIDFTKLAKPTAISYAARDGTTISAYLTLPKGREAKGLPLIILPHGGPFGIRDSLTYNDEVQFLANRGYAVLQPNFRGSGGYGDAFYELGNGQVGRGMQDDLDDAMDWAVAQGVADKDRVCVVGGSYGGYAALWAVLRNPERYRCAASWAGVTDWDRMLTYDRRYLTRNAGKRWIAKIEGDDNDFDLKDVSPYRLAKNLSRPVLLAHGTDDSNVPFKQFEQMQQAAKNASVPPELLVIEDEGHSFSKATSEKAWYDALETFLAKHNPAQ